MSMSWARLLLVLSLAACSSISTVRVQPETVYVAPGLKPVAVIYARATSAYLLFVPLPGHVDLDRVLNRMLLATAKTLGADKVVNIRVDITPDDGVWILRRTRPDAYRPFRVPWAPLTCTLGALVCLGMTLALSNGTWIRLLVWTIIGMSIYAFYGFRHSRLRK